MDRGWFKIWRKIWDNELLKRNNTAFKLFIWCISKADKKTHSFTTGRFQIEEQTGIKSTTAYYNLKIMEKSKMLTLSSNNRFTTISISNYDKYQNGLTQSIDNNLTTIRQQFDTKQELKNKELKNIYNNNIYNNISTSKVEDIDKGISKSKGLNKFISKDMNTETKVSGVNTELQELIDFSKELNFPLQGSIKMNRYNASNLLRKFGLEKSKKLVQAAVDCRGKPYAPQVNDFIQLYRKCGDLVNYYAKEKNERNRKIIG